jgi:hypothetical protein
MVIRIREYNSGEEISQNIERKISEIKSTLGDYLRRLDDVRGLAERSKKIREVVMKLSGEKAKESLGEITISNLDVVLDANAFHELEALEEVVQSHQKRLLKLQKANESLNWLDQFEDTEGIKYLVIENDDVPERILFKLL